MLTVPRLAPYTPMTAPPCASRYIRFNGREILRGTGFLAGTKITCPAGHVMNSDAIVLADAVLFCDHRPQKGHAACGALVYLLTIPARGVTTHRFWLADCTREEVREIQQLALDADGIVAYFGGSFSR